MIRVDRGEELVTITLDRPAVRNALTPDMLTGIIDAQERAAEAGLALLINGNGPVFCAGFDLDLCRRSPDGSALRLLLSGLSDACRALRAHQRPVVIAAHGAAVAGGCAILGGADLVVADRNASMGYPVIRLGISPAVSAPFLRLCVSDGNARRALLLPELFSAEHAHAVGLVHYLEETAEAVAARAHALALELARKPAVAFAATKRWLARIEGLDQRAVSLSLETSLGLTGGEEERQRLAATTPSQTPGHTLGHTPGPPASKPRPGAPA
jgi:methylglutaconyl-CoA hydratase